MKTEQVNARKWERENPKAAAVLRVKYDEHVAACAKCGVAPAEWERFIVKYAGAPESAKAGLLKTEKAPRYEAAMSYTQYTSPKIGVE